MSLAAERTAGKGVRRGDGVNRAEVAATALPPLEAKTGLRLRFGGRDEACAACDQEALAYICPSAAISACSCSRAGPCQTS